MTEALKSTGWYQKAGSDGALFYSPFRSSKQIHLYHGDGELHPTPKQVAEFLDKHPGADFIRGNIFTIYDHKRTDEPEVELPAGTYSYEPGNPDNPPRLIPMDLRRDSYLETPGMFGDLATDVKDFLGAEGIYRDMGIQYRRGILLYGPPGNGKTSLIRELVRKSIPEDSLVIFMDLLPGRSFIDAIRKTLADRMKVFVFEELAAVMEQTRLEKVLDFLDGERSVDRSIVLATTNFPEKLPHNLVDRPSRFDRLYKMPDPDDATRKTMMEYFLKTTVGEQDVVATRGLSIVALREVAILVKKSRYSVPKAVKQLKEHRELVKKEFAESKSIGFGFNRGYGGYHDED